MKFMWITMCVVIKFSSLSAFGAEEPKMSRATFVEPPGTLQPATESPARTALRKVEVIAEARAVQTDLKQGLLLDVVVTNSNATAVEFRDLPDFLQVQVSNSRGYPVGLSPVPTGVRRPKGTIPADDLLAGPKPYEIVAVDGQAIKTPPATALASTIRLDAGKSRRLTIRIEKIIANAEEYQAKVRKAQSEPASNPNVPLDPPEVVAIPAGKYGVKLWIALVPPNDAANALRLATEPLMVSLEAPGK